LVACGDGGGGGPDAPPQPVDATADDSFGATFPPPAQLFKGTGGVMTTPTVVPIFFAGDDAMQAQMEGFFAALPSSTYWPAIAAEYGVGALTFAPTIVSTDAPPVTGLALQQWIRTNAGNKGWPAPGPNTLFAVFTPAGVTVSDAGFVSCVDYGAYHSEVMGTPIIFALMPRCSPSLDHLTANLTHEVIEAATDPHPYTSPGWSVIDQPDEILAFLPGAEVGDLCEYLDAVDQPLVGTYKVPRIWSNAAAGSGHHPCVPAPAVPFITAAANVSGTVFFPGRGGQDWTRGIQLPVGATTTIDVVMYSDVPTEPWTVVPLDAASVIGGGPPELALSVAPAVGTSGSHLTLTVTRKAAGAGTVPGGSAILLSVRTAAQVEVSQSWAYVGN
jgi:hypothetical protein